MENERPDKIGIVTLVAAECLSGRNIVCPAHVAKAVGCSREEAYKLLRVAERDGLVERAGNRRHAKWRIQWDDSKWRD